MLDSLDRIDRFSRRMDKLLGPAEQENPDGTLAWSTASVLTEYRDRPVEFIREVLGEELEIALPDGSICSYQADICRGLVTHDRVTCRSGQKTGKSYIAIRIAVWWVCTRPNGRVVLTSSSDAQVKDPLWREIHDLHRRLHARDIHLLPPPALDPATGVRWEDGRSIKGFSTNKPVNAAGKSGADQLFILDEASGIPNDITEAFIGNTMGGGKVFAISNPTEMSGFFFDTFHSRREHWLPFQLSARDTPNYRAGAIVVPGLATRERVAELVAAYGEDSPFVQVRVNGDFPTQASNSVIGLGLVEEALKRWRSGDTGVAPYFDVGVDVARFGDDDTAIVGRRGLQGLESRVSHGNDGPHVAGLVIKFLRDHRSPGERTRIKVDVIGYGASVVDHLVFLQDEGKTPELLGGVSVISINVAESPDEGEPAEQYERKRDQLWFGMRNWLRAGGALPPNPKVEAELLAPTYSVTTRGKIKVESKDEIKKTLRRSPDVADAWCLAVHDEPTAAPIQVTSKIHTYESPIAF